MSLPAVPVAHRTCGTRRGNRADTGADTGALPRANSGTNRAVTLTNLNVVATVTNTFNLHGHRSWLAVRPALGRGDDTMLDRERLNVTLLFVVRCLSLRLIY